MTLFILIVLDSDLSHFYCVWPLHLIAATGVLGDNAGDFYNDWYVYSMTFSLFVQSAVVYLLTVRLSR
jgi:hypothetical protein